MKSIMKKVLSTALVVTLTAGISIGGTLAYLTDRDSTANVFTVGDVAIELNESFEQGEMLIPGVKIEKEPTITNTGKNDAWVWATVAIPAVLDSVNDASKNIVHFNYNNEYVNEEQWTWKDSAGWMVKETKINNVDYNVYTVLYQTALKSGDKTPAVMTKVYMDTHIDIAPNGDWYWVEDGSVFGPYWNSDTNGTPVIYVSAYAMQTEGFKTVQDAYNAYNKQWGDNTTEYGAVNYNNIVIKETGVYEIKDDIITVDSAYIHTQNATGPVTINGNGNTIKSVASSADSLFTWEGGTIPAMSTIFSSANGSDVTVNDLNFSGTMTAIMLGHYQGATYTNYNTILNNVNVIDTEVVSFSADIAPAVCAYGTATLNNCNIYGTTLSELDTDLKYPVYDFAATNYTDVTINNSKIGSIYMWNQAKITVEADSEVDTIVIRGNMNPPKYGLTIKKGATVGSIDLSAITNKQKVNISIEEGATVDKIVANGLTYGSVTDWQNAE